VGEGSNFIIRLPALPNELLRAGARDSGTPSPAQSAQTPEPRPLAADDRLLAGADERHRGTGPTKKRRRTATS